MAKIEVGTRWGFPSPAENDGCFYISGIDLSKIGTVSSTYPM